MSKSTHHLLTLNPKEMFTQVAHAVSRDVIAMIHGSPGIAKSAVCHKVATQLKLEVIDWRGSSADPTDTNGLPFRNTHIGKAEYLPFDTFPLEGDNLPLGCAGWLLIMEEINQAPQAVIAACYKLLHDRMVGNRKLHPMVRIVTTGNLVTDGAQVRPMGTAMGSRLVHLVMKNEDKETIDFMVKDNFDARIVAFANFRPGLIYNFDVKTQEFTFTCIRTWTYVNTLIRGVTDLRQIKPLICGAIGNGAGTEFVAFCQVFHRIPDLPSLLLDPANAGIPGDLDIQWAMCTAIVEDMNATNLSRWVTYVMRMSIEFRILVVQLLFAKDPDLALDPSTDALIADVKDYL